MLYVTSLPGFTIILQVHHHSVLYVSARGHNPSTSTSPCCILRLCPRWKSLYKYIAILYFTSLAWLTILLHAHHHNVLTSLPGFTNPLQVHHHTVLYVSARGHNPSTSTSPSCTLRLCPGSQSFYKYITILYLTSLPGVTILLQVHHHTLLYVSVRVLILLQVHHHTLLYVSTRVHNHSTSTSPYCTLRLCPGSQSSYKYITILYFTYLPGVTILLQLHHHTVLYVFARVHNPSTTTSLYCTLRLCLGHNPSTSTSPYCTLRLYPESQSSYKYITILYFSALPGVAILLQVHHHNVL